MVFFSLLSVYFLGNSRNKFVWRILIFFKVDPSEFSSSTFSTMISYVLCILKTFSILLLPRKMEDLDTYGWSFILNFERLSMYAPGSEPLLDLISIMEQPPVFPGQTANSLLSVDRTNQLPTENMDIVIQ